VLANELLWIGVPCAAFVAIVGAARRRATTV
jgi:hypothetical protein